MHFLWTFYAGNNLLNLSAAPSFNLLAEHLTIHNFGSPQNYVSRCIRQIAALALLTQEATSWDVAEFSHADRGFSLCDVERTSAFLRIS